jgi:hypothetical protein
VKKKKKSLFLWEQETRNRTSKFRSSSLFFLARSKCVAQSCGRPNGHGSRAGERAERSRRVNCAHSGVGGRRCGVRFSVRTGILDVLWCFVRFMPLILHANLPRGDAIWGNFFGYFPRKPPPSLKLRAPSLRE